MTRLSLNQVWLSRCSGFAQASSPLCQKEGASGCGKCNTPDLGPPIRGPERPVRRCQRGSTREYRRGSAEVPARQWRPGDDGNQSYEYNTSSLAASESEGDRVQAIQSRLQPSISSAVFLTETRIGPGARTGSLSLGGEFLPVEKIRSAR